jgi:hypothetical protein
MDVTGHKYLDVSIARPIQPLDPYLAGATFQSLQGH